MLVLTILAGIAAVLLGLVARQARAEASAARATAERHRALLASLPEVSVMLFDAELRWTLVEGDGLAGRGWQPEELEGRRVDEVLPPDRAAVLAEHYRAALDGETRTFDWPGVRGGPHRVDVAPVRGPGGAITGGVCVARDVSARRALEAELEEQREFLAAALEQLTEPVVICDATGRVILVNAAARTMHGFAPEPATTSSVDWAERSRLRSVDGRPLAPAEIPLFRALAGEVVRDEPHTVEGPGGRRRVLVSAGAVTAADGRPLGAVGVSTDVTAAHGAELALRASEARYRSVVDGVDEAVFQADAAGRFTFLNDAFERWTGHPVRVALGRPAWEFVHPDDRTAHSQAFAPLLTGRAGHLRHRHRYVTADGRVRWAEVRARLVDGAGIAGVIEDVTDRQRAEEYDVAREAVADLLAAPGAAPATVPEVLSTLCRGLEWDAAELWTMEDERLRPGETWHARGVDPGLAGADVTLEVGEGAPGRAWALRRPVWLGDLEAERDCPRSAAAVQAGARSALLLPVVSGRRVRAIVVLLSRREREPEPAAARALDAIATRIALFFERADAERLIARQALDLAELRARLLSPH